MDPMGITPYHTISQESTSISMVLTVAFYPDQHFTWGLWCAWRPSEAKGLRCGAWLAAASSWRWKKWGVCMWEFVHLTGHQNDKKLLNMAIYSWFMLIFPLIAWWFSIGFLYVYQRVTCINHQHPTSNIQQHPATSSNPWVAVWSSWFFNLFARDFEKCRA